MTAVKITAGFSDILMQSVWRLWLRCCLLPEKAPFVVLCKGKTELRPTGAKCEKKQHTSGLKRLGKEFFIPITARRRVCGVMLMGMYPFCFMAPVHFFIVAAGKNPVRKQTAAILIVS